MGGRPGRAPRRAGRVPRRCRRPAAARGGPGRAGPAAGARDRWGGRRTGHRRRGRTGARSGGGGTRLPRGGPVRVGAGGARPGGGGRRRGRAGFRRPADRLRPVLDYDARRGTVLTKTLEAYFGCGGSPARAAELLHVHVNTVVQRLERLGGLLGPDWQQPERALDLQLALRLYRLGPASAGGG